MEEESDVSKMIEGGFYCLLLEEQQFWQSLTDKSTFVEVQQSSREVPAHHWNKDTQDLMHWKALENSFTLFTSPLIQDGIA